MTVSFKRTSIIVFVAVFVLSACLAMTIFAKDAYGDYESGSEVYDASGLPASGSPPQTIEFYFNVGAVSEYANSAQLKIYVDDVDYPITQIDKAYFMGSDGQEHYLGIVVSTGGFEWITFTLDPSWVGEGINTVKYVIADGWYTWIGEAKLNVGYNLWIRDSEMMCRHVWINEDNMFQFVFIYPYADNNWVRIYDMEGNMVFEADMPLDNPNLIVDLPDGMYTVKTYHDQPEPLQTFVIGKP